MDALVAQPPQDRPVQHSEQLTPVDRDLRPAVTGGLPARLAPDSLPVLRVEDQLGRRDTHGGQVVEQPQLGQLAHGMGQDVDADAQLPHG